VPSPSRGWRTASEPYLAHFRRAFDAEVVVDDRTITVRMATADLPRADESLRTLIGSIDQAVGGSHPTTTPTAHRWNRTGPVGLEAAAAVAISSIRWGGTTDPSAAVAFERGVAEVERI
jgi:hypothetical protein